MCVLCTNFSLLFTTLCPHNGTLPEDMVQHKASRRRAVSGHWRWRSSPSDSIGIIAQLYSMHWLSLKNGMRISLLSFIPFTLPHLQLFQHYPVLDPLYTRYEKNFYASTYVKFAQDTWPVLPLALCGMYALMIIVGTKVMASRPKHEWKTALACWNLMLSIFSFCGMIRTVPHLLHNVATLPFKVGTPLDPLLPPFLPHSLSTMPPSRPLRCRLALGPPIVTATFTSYILLFYFFSLFSGHDLPAPRGNVR